MFSVLGEKANTCAIAGGVNLGCQVESLSSGRYCQLIRAYSTKNSPTESLGAEMGTREEDSWIHFCCPSVPFCLKGSIVSSL